MLTFINYKKNLYNAYEFVSEECGWMKVGFLPEGFSFNPTLNPCVNQRFEEGSLHCFPLHYKEKAKQDPFGLKKNVKVQ